MPDSIVINGVVIPADAQSLQAVRSSGPGGQNVNKVSSKVILTVDLGRISGLDDPSRTRLAKIVRNRLDADGRLVVTSQRTRNQSRNLQDAQSKLRNWIAKAMVEPKKRIRTGPSKASQARRLEEKQRRARLKRSRRRSKAEDE